MTVAELYDMIGNMVEHGEVYWASPVTVHAYVRDGIAIEWKDKDIQVECNNPKGDGLEINVDTENTGIVYLDEYDTDEDKQNIIKQLLNFKDKDGNQYFNENFIARKYVK